MATYTRMRLDPAGLVGDATTLYRLRSRALESDAEATAQATRALDVEVRAATGAGIKGKRLLVVGTGQTLREVYGCATFGANVTGIDLDVVPIGFDPIGYVRLWQRNGFVRFAKTVGRRALGVDRRFEHALARRLGADGVRSGKLLLMDASNMSFPDASFDVVYSHSVFEHLPEPAAATREIARVLAPGGVAHLSVHLYSSEGGCHDLRIFAGERAAIPYWAHLRPAHRDRVRESCYVNRWSLAAWEALFDAVLPGCVHEYEPHHASFDRTLRAALGELRAAGELAEYGDRDLLTVNLITRWTKPR